MARRSLPLRPPARITHPVLELSIKVIRRTKLKSITYVFISFKQMLEKIQLVLVISI
jgi:hypothetical protein